MDPKERSSDKAAQEMIQYMADKGLENAWDRLDAQMPQCGFGKQGVCCRHYGPVPGKQKGTARSLRR